MRCASDAQAGWQMRRHRQSNHSTHPFEKRKIRSISVTDQVQRPPPVVGFIEVGYTRECDAQVMRKLVGECAAITGSNIPLTGENSGAFPL